MPQMAPINWLILFVMFSTLFITFNIMNYFLISYNPSNNPQKIYKKMIIIWKW